MALPPTPAGWTRFLVKSKFGAGRDFAVSDPATEEQRYFVDGKFGVQPKAEIRAGGNDPVYRVKGSLLGFPKHMTITDATGAEVASLRAKTFSPITSALTKRTTSRVSSACATNSTGCSATWACTSTTCWTGASTCTRACRSVRQHTRQAPSASAPTPPQAHST
jgi:hypothetical protein